MKDVFERGRGLDGVSLWTRPGDRRGLRHWLQAHLGMMLPERGSCAGHDSPLDYLEHVFFEREPRDVLVWACRGGGKTKVGAAATVLDLMFKPGIEVRVLAGSAEQGQRMFGYLRGFFGQERFVGVVKEETKARIGLVNGSGVEVLAQSERSVRGQRVQKVRCDEVELFVPEVWEAVQLMTRSERGMKGSVEGLSTMHKAGGLMQGLMERAEADGRKVFRWCVWDVLAECGKEVACGGCGLWEGCGGVGKVEKRHGFVQREDVLAMKGRVSQGAWRHEMLCERPRVEGRVFVGFERAVHVRAWPGVEGLGAMGWRFERWAAGVDFGWKAPFVWLQIAVLRDGAGRKGMWVAGERRASRETLGRHLMEVERWVDGSGGKVGRAEVVYCDPAGRALNAQTGFSDEAVLREAGYEVKSRASKVEEGVGLLMALMMPMAGGARLLVDPGCAGLVAGLEGIRRGGDGRVEKDGVLDHVVDALRYAAVGVCGRGGEVEVRQY